MGASQVSKGELVHHDANHCTHPGPNRTGFHSEGHHHAAVHDFTVTVFGIHRARHTNSQATPEQQRAEDSDQAADDAARAAPLAVPAAIEVSR